MDKDVFNDKLRGVMGYNKVKMAVSYGKYHETEYKIRELGKLKLEVENTGPVMEGHAPSKMTYCGISAIDTVAKLKQQDLEAARTVRENGFIDRKTVEQQHLTLSYGKETLADIVFEELLVNALVHRDYFISSPV